ncbi:MAG: BMC domain-containing protein [Deltaproteobacteria bacterium]|nr:BMC domain-containing protein [Deltaproteobacteria bacterium]
MEPALALLEFDSIALGIRTGNVMAKRTPLSALHCGTVQPGKYLVLAAGEVAEVEEALLAAREAVAEGLVAEIFLPSVHPQLVRGLCGDRREPQGEAVGVIETRTVATVLAFADAALKGAQVELLKIQLADGLGGKGYALLSGEMVDVEAALEVGEERADPSALVASELISRMDPVMMSNLVAAGEFAGRLPALEGG